MEPLADYAAGFAADFRRRDQARWLGVYLQGLLSTAVRKNIETMAREVRLADSLSVEDIAQALQNFVNQSPWDERKLLRRYRAHVARELGSPDGVFVVHDVSFPKQGQQSVGVQRQYSPELRRKINCQVAVAVSYVTAAGSCPLDLRLYLPRSWLTDPGRLETAGVPGGRRVAADKPRIALELLDAVRSEGLPGRVVVGGGSYGASAELRDWLSEQGCFFLLGVGEDHPVFPADPHELLNSFSAPGSIIRPLPVRDLAKAVSWIALPEKPTARHEPVASYAWLPVLESRSPAAAVSRGNQTHGLLIEKRDGCFTYALGNLPPATTCSEAACIWRQKLHTAALYRRLRNELGLDHFEGRSWRGFHHHVSLVMAAFGFTRAANDLGTTSGTTDPGCRPSPTLRQA
jgi:SRSO17 transposase